MKISIRKGIFETNSSSTHAIALIDTKTKYKVNHGDYERKIVSKKHKLIFFSSALCLYTQDSLYNYEDEATEKGKDNETIENRKKQIKKECEYYEKLMIKLYCELTNEDINETTKMLKELNKGRYPAFLDYFNNDTLDGYYGSHIALVKNLIKKPNDDYSLTERFKNFFDDSVYIEIIEDWYGGQDYNLPPTF